MDEVVFRRCMAVAGYTRCETIPLRSVRGKKAELGRRQASNAATTLSAKLLQYVGGGQVFWLPGRPTPRTFPSRRTVACSGFRRRLQQRDCDGFSPSSLGPFLGQCCAVPSFYCSFNSIEKEYTALNIVCQEEVFEKFVSVPG